MPRRKEEQRINLVMNTDGDAYVSMQSYEVLALGDSVQVEKARSQGHIHVTYYIRKNK